MTRVGFTLCKYNSKVEFDIIFQYKSEEFNTPSVFWVNDKEICWLDDGEDDDNDNGENLYITLTSSLHVWKGWLV